MKEHFGKYATDVVSHFEGAVIGCAEYVDAGRYYLIQPQVDSVTGDTKKLPEAQWFHESRVMTKEGKPLFTV